MKNLDKKIDKDFIKNHIEKSKEAKSSLLLQTDKIIKIIETLKKTIINGGTIFSCGNGGSSCDAMHLTEELVARYEKHRPGIKAQHLWDPSIITCWANDYNFEEIFERQIQTFINPRDALLAFSTSGNSKNIIKALASANSQKATTILLSGQDGGKAIKLASLSITVNSQNTAHIQESHITLVHLICKALEKFLLEEKEDT